MKSVGILGATGSIGRNCLQVLAAKQDEFAVGYLTTNRNVELLLQQARRFRPQAVGILHEAAAQQFLPGFRELGIEVLTGFDGILEISDRDDVDIVVNALVGAAGLQPTLNAIKPNRRIALANKETLVIGGQFVMSRARDAGAEIIPIDSEHSALLQCLTGEDASQIRSVILTASGGPFRRHTQAELSGVSVEEALNHPNWDMGPKITIDSATLMNKGLEVIEARWLFDLQPSQIQVVIHPQSIIHSMVEFEDGSIKAQLGLPDMRIPIQYALTYPRRLTADFPRLDFFELQQLTFERPDLEKFRCLHLSYQALAAGGAAPAVLNAANEEAVNLYLAKKIRFDQIPHIVEEALENCHFDELTDLAELLECDRTTRHFVLENFHATLKEV